MLKLTWVASALLVLSFFAATPAVAQCTWGAPASPPSFAAAQKRHELTYKLDRAWFRCAKKAGGKLSLQFLIDGKVHEEKSVRSASIKTSLYHASLCRKLKGAHRVQAKLVGSGAMSRVAYASPVLELYCPRCEYRSHDNALGLGIGGRKAHFMSKVDKRWHACAKKGAKMVARFFVAKTRKEAQIATKPTFVLRGLERKNFNKRKFSTHKLCRGGKKMYVAFDLFGTGEMARINSKHRQVKELSCR